ncbi:MAG: restriction endonuclease [Proteobacteria bacterium]|nr:restriction endonuclease [Pseudomonadota bacterium]
MYIYKSITEHKYDGTQPLNTISKGKGFYFLDENPEVFFVPRVCPYCNAPCELLGLKDKHDREGFDYWQYIAKLYVCNTCGWWTIPVLTFHEELDNEYMSVSYGQARGELAAFNPTDCNLNLTDLRRHLIADYKRRKIINPFHLEEVVGQAFEDAGYKVICTPKSNDKGVDLFLGKNSDEKCIAVQIKRYKNKIEPELIRSFAGAMLLNGSTNGIFVTTSDYTIGAKNTANALQMNQGYKIELKNAAELYEMLKINMSPQFNDIEDETAPFYDVWNNPIKYSAKKVDSMCRVEI